MLGAESVQNPKIKVVPYVKHYNIALVNSSMQGLQHLVPNWSNMSYLKEETHQGMA